MIASDFLVFNINGLYCRAGDFYLDPQQSVPRAVISHAHADHAVSGNQQVWCTRPTAAFMEHRYKKNAASVFHIKSYREQFTINGVIIYFLPAGHMLGAAQIMLQHNGIRYLYTGDFKLQPDNTCEPATFEPADVLITETTFANPQTSHPDVLQEMQKLNQHNHNILLGAYSLGKSQRLVSLLNTHCPQRQVLIHHSILPLNKLYESLGYSPGLYQPYNRKLMKEPGRGYVYLVPPVTFNSYFKAKSVMRVFASGWKHLQTQNDMTLYLSDHADWNDILKAITEVSPKEVWTLHGDGRFLQQHFNSRLTIKIL